MVMYGTHLLYGSYLCFEWETREIDKVYNKSTVYVRIYVTNNRVPGLGGGNASCVINGTCGCSFTMDIDGIEWYGNPDASLTEDGVRERTLYENTFVIQHNSDGKKTVRMCATVTDITISRGGTTETLEEEYICKYIALENIPQASEFESIERDVEINGENDLNIVIAPLDDRCRHDLIISLGDYSETVYNAKNTVSFVPPIEWLSSIPTAETAVGLITLRTFDAHGMKIGEVQTYWNAFVPDNAVPEFDELTIEQIQGGFPLTFGWIQYASKAHLELVGARSKWGADIVGYSIKGCGYSGAESILDTDTINRSGVCTFKAYVTDSRGKTSEIKTVSINVTPYNPPRFLNVLSQRCESDGTIKNEGSYMLSNVLFEYDSFEGLNTCTQAIYYKKTTDSEYKKLSTSFVNGTATVSETVFDISTSYDIQYRLTDLFGISVYNDILSVSHISMEFLKGGKGISFGKEAEVENAVDCGYKLYTRNGIMPLSAANGEEKASEAGLRAYTLFAVKLSIFDKYILCYRGLDSDTIAGSYSEYEKTPQEKKKNPANHFTVILEISEDGMSYTGVIRHLSTSFLFNRVTRTISVPVSGGNQTVNFYDSETDVTGATTEYDIDIIEKIYAIL